MNVCGAATSSVFILQSGLDQLGFEIEPPAAGAGPSGHLCQYRKTNVVPGVDIFASRIAQPDYEFHSLGMLSASRETLLVRLLLGLASNDLGLAGAASSTARLVLHQRQDAMDDQCLGVGHQRRRLAAA